ncbi:hypothetical protein J6590_020249 [Homalodisca vitripennis]|nr:hypothetical protein J6590_020249 [Homalodisca vitripennis]
MTYEGSSNILTYVDDVHSVAGSARTSPEAQRPDHLTLSLLDLTVPARLVICILHLVVKMQLHISLFISVCIQSCLAAHVALPLFPPAPPSPHAPPTPQQRLARFYSRITFSVQTGTKRRKSDGLRYCRYNRHLCTSAVVNVPLIAEMSGKMTHKMKRAMIAVMRYGNT